MLGAPTPLVFAISLAIALLLLWRQGTLDDLGQTASDADFTLVAAAALLYLVGLALLCARWHVLVVMVAGRSDAQRAAEAFLTSVVVNYAAPIGIAVPTRAALTMRSLSLSAGQTSAVALWEIAADAMVLGVAALIWLALGNGEIVTDTVDRRLAVWIAVAAAIAGAAAVVIALRRPAWRERLGVVGRSFLNYPGRRRGDAAIALGLSIGFWLLQAGIFAILLRAVEITPDPGLVVGVLALPVLIGMFSPIPGGAGVREALMVAVAQARDVNGAAVLFAAVAYRAALFTALPVLYAIVRLWMWLETRHEAVRDVGGKRG